MVVRRGHRKGGSFFGAIKSGFKTVGNTLNKFAKKTGVISKVVIPYAAEALGVNPIIAKAATNFTASKGYGRRRGGVRKVRVPRVGGARKTGIRRGGARRGGVRLHNSVVY